VQNVRAGSSAEIAGARRTPSLSDAAVPDTQVRLSETTFLIGPAIRIVQRERFCTSGRLLFGAARITSSFPSDLVQSRIAPGQTPASIGVFQDQTAFAFGFGSTLDITVTPSVALRFSPGLL
jgi:hypothetical protein